MAELCGTGEWTGRLCPTTSVGLHAICNSSGLAIQCLDALSASRRGKVDGDESVSPKGWGCWDGWDRWDGRGGVALVAPCHLADSFIY